MDNIREEIQKSKYALMSILQEFEQDRKKIFFKYIACNTMAFILFVVGIIIFYALQLNINTPNVIPIWIYITIILACIASAIFLGLYARDIEYGFKNLLKNTCYKKALNVFGDIKRYNGGSETSNVGINDAILRNSGLFDNFNRRTIDDEFKGTYKDVNFKISETNMELEIGGGRRRRYMEIFRGAVVQLDLKRSITNKIIISKKTNLIEKIPSSWLLFIIFLLVTIPATIIAIGAKMFNFLFGLLIFFVCIFIVKLVINKFGEGKSASKIKLGKDEFNKIYDIYSSDKNETRSLIKPFFMEKLNNLAVAFRSKNIKCSFFDENKLLIAISTNRNLFEMGVMSKPLTNPQFLEDFYNEFFALYDLIDCLEFDEQLDL